MARGETREARAQREAEEDAKDAEADRIMELAGKRLEQERHCLKKRDELMLFVSAGEIERVAFVLSGKKKPDVGMRDFGGNNLVALAVEGDRRVVLELLLDAGAAADNVDYVGHTPLMLAALHDRVECGYRCAVAAPAALDTQGRRDGRTALHMACRHGHAKMTKLLVDAGARVDLTDFRALTARDLAPEDELNHWLLEAKLHCGEDKIPVIAESLDRSRFRSRHALANADPEDLRPLGIRGDDVDRVKTKAVQELPDLEDEELDEMQRVDGDFEFDFTGSDPTAELKTDKSGIEYGPQAVTHLREDKGRARANTNIRAHYHHANRMSMAQVSELANEYS
ncbi:hypothetical protein JL721_5098 [Aureococcus anophagefferens]|nr:hypothetical protein JL721_5098 [Aureococcus anophagefferens]